MLYSMHLWIKYRQTVISAVLFLKGGPKGVTVRVVKKGVDDFHIHQFSYLAFGLSGSLAEEWVHRPEPLAAALAALMGSEIWDPVEKKLECLRAIERAEVDEARRFALVNVVGTYIQLEGEQKERFNEAVQQPQNEKILEVEMTWAQQKVAEWREEGREEGLKDGLKKGRLAFLQRLLESKFGPLPPQATDRLQLADTDRLELWGERTLTAQSLDEVLGA